MNHHDAGGDCVTVPPPWWFALCSMSTAFPVIRTTPENARILEFLVMGRMKKRVTIVARKISEERDERNTGRVDLSNNRLNR